MYLRILVSHYSLKRKEEDITRNISRTKQAWLSYTYIM